jgi:hypothetical protein
MKIQHRRIGALALGCTTLAFAVACSKGAEVAAPDMPSAGMLSLDRSSANAVTAGNPALAKQLAELRGLTAKYHNFREATDPETGDYPGLFIAPGLTSPDGCVSDTSAGGMGYHYAGSVGIDDEVDFRTPELLVYAPPEGPAKIGDDGARAKLAAFDYFIPFSDAWPDNGPAPTSADMGLAINPPIAFAPSRFGGWMFHIWLWEDNPGGMFANWNTDVPLCANSPA